MSEVRVDKWLWAVRIYKTRSVAADACRSNHVLVNGTTVKPSREIKVGDKVQIKKMPITYSYEVAKAISSRVGAPLAAEAAINVTPQEEMDKLKQNIAIFARRDAGTGRPTKKERRDIDTLMDEFSGNDLWDEEDDDI